MTNLKYFVNGYTSQGEVNLFKHNLHFIKDIFLLKHESKAVTTKIIEHIINQLTEKFSMEIICSPYGNQYIDGLIVRHLSVALITQNINHTDLENLNIININHGQSIGVTEYDQGHHHLKRAACEHFKNAFQTHEKLEKIFISEMNFSKANKIRHDLEKLLLNNVEFHHGESIIYQRFFGTNTLDGIVNEIEDLIAPLKKRIFLKGRAGTGKSYLMKKIKEKCFHLGLNMEVYLCSLDPNSIDMIINRELGFCILDSTFPHEFKSINNNDIVIDMYDAAVKKGTEEDNFELIDQYRSIFKIQLNQGIEKLKEVKILVNEKESIWRKKIKEDDIRFYSNKIMNKINNNK